MEKKTITHGEVNVTESPILNEISAILHREGLTIREGVGTLLTIVSIALDEEEGFSRLQCDVGKFTFHAFKSDDEEIKH